METDVNLRICKTAFGEGERHARKKTPTITVGAFS